MLATYASALLAKLDNSDRGVCKAVRKLLGKLELDVLAKHVPALLA